MTLGRSPATAPAPSPNWQPVARTRTYEMVIDAIEEQILSGALGVGDPLPPERDLAARLQVSRPAVREASRVLEAQGVLRSAVGSGSGAGTFVAATPAEALTHFLRLHIALSNFAFADVVDARVTLESSSVELAARAHDPARLAPVHEAMATMEAAVDDRAAFNDADIAFHTAIAEAGGNRLVTAMTVAIRNAQRRAILDAITAGDADRASRLAARHIRNAYDSLPTLHDHTI